MVYCPKCKNVVRFVELSCGGDGLYVCDVCGWVENPTVNNENSDEFSGVDSRQPVDRFDDER